MFKFQLKNLQSLLQKSIDNWDTAVCTKDYPLYEGHKAATEEAIEGIEQVIKNTCSDEKYKSSLDGYPDIKVLARQIANLRYDALAELLLELATCLEDDSKSDSKRGRTKLASWLYNAYIFADKTASEISMAWDVCAPFMKEENIGSKNRTACHPSEILIEEFNIKNYNLSELEEKLNLSASEINALVSCKLDINNELAANLAVFFSTTKEFWINLQDNYNKTK